MADATRSPSVDPTPAFPFGHGLAYTTFEWSDACAVGPDGQPDPDPDTPVVVPVDGEVTVQVTVRNTGTRAGTEVVQFYLHDPVAQTTRPVVRLVGYARVPLEPGAGAAVTFQVPPTWRPSPGCTAGASSSPATWNCGSAARAKRC